MNYAALFNELTDADNSRGALRPPGLTEEQWQALASPLKQSAVICAGAGAGKTRLLINRVARLLREGVPPEKIVVVTFTRKAAAELMTRLGSEMRGKKALPTCATVHALAYAHAKRHRMSFNLVDDEQLIELVRDMRLVLPEAYDGVGPKEILLSISRTRESRQPGAQENMVAAAFEELMRQNGWDDFTSILATGLTLPSTNVTHVLVDESQDLSELQLAFLQRYAPTAHFWFIGDPDQAIYGFRGAHASMMHRLKEETTGFYPLTANFRCADLILQHAMNVIVNNPNRLDLRFTSKSKEQGRVEVLPFDTDDRELFEAQAWLQAAPAGTSRAVLARTQAALQPLKEQGLPALTIHESKGLEWDEVWVLGCEAGLLPHPMAPRDEERRLFYVAMTRAKKALTLSYAEARGQKSKTEQHPSPFLFETQALLRG